MYIVKNAYKSIVRAKGRNILIFYLGIFDCCMDDETTDETVSSDESVPADDAVEP